jgi:hypothetical protein
VSFSDAKIVGDVTPPEKGHLAFFGELDYEIDGLRERGVKFMRPSTLT